ncbi:hypothetical protein A9Q89_06465 [Gammaproteobacteria bacterium 53_120_T64]|nr:hypothetical protein A9Q89_06465 [Gammaproteobacteria bacterium 53_120_T64]
MKAIKWTIASLVVLVLLASIVVAYFVVAIDPNRYKPQLTQLAHEQGIALKIAGDLSWQLLPSLAISVGATQITSPRSDIPQVSFAQAELSLAWLPLLRRQLSVKAIRLEGADIRLGSAQQAGNTAAAPLAAAPLSTKQADNLAATPADTDAAPAFGLAIKRLEIANSRLQLPPTADATGPQQLSDIQLLIEDLNLDGEAFTLKASFAYSDPALPAPVAVKLDTTASVAQHSQAMTLSQTSLELLLADKPPVHISIDALSVEQGDALQLDISGLQVNSAGAQLQASLSAQGFSTQDSSTEGGDETLTFTSEITVPPLALHAVLAAWDIELPPLPDTQALQQASLKLSIKGSNTGLSISDLVATLDDITLTGSAQLALQPTRNISLQLQSSAIDLNRYIDSTNASDSNDKQHAGANSHTPAEVIFAPLVGPLLWVGDGTAHLDIAIDALQLDAIAAKQLQIKIEASNNIVQIRQLAAEVFDGDINASATINLQGKEPTVNFSTTVNALAVDQALHALSGEAALRGRLKAKFQGQSHGGDAEQLHQHLKANGDITLSQPYLTTFNIEKSYCEIAALIEKIPRKNDWPQGSQLQDVQANIEIQGKQVFIRHYSSGLGNISLKGKGLIDLDKERFDLLATSRLKGERTSAEGCRVKSQRVRDKDIPIRCKDSFAKAGGGSCKPDGDFVKQVLQDKLLEQIQRKSGLDKESEDAVKGLLKGLFGR